MSNYLIKLTPLSPFFFAGEKNFGDGTNANYFAKSNLFPQQTTVLGMLRKELLIQEGIYKEKWDAYSQKDKEENIPNLIGQSFQLSENSNKNNFGKIEKISPLFLCRGNEFFISMPKDHGFKDCEFCFEKKKGRAFLNNSKDIIPFIKGYNHKDGLPKDFISSDSKEPVKFDNIFEPFEKVGNAKDKKEGDDDKFFKQLFYTMNKDFCFAFFAELDFELKKESIVFMGGDNSSFKMTFEKSNTSFEKLFISNKRENNKVTLLSDALVDENMYDFCEFAITETIDFRTISMEEGRFKSRNKYKCTMLQRGSVFFTTMRDDLTKKLKNDLMEKIGYNIFR